MTRAKTLLLIVLTALVLWVPSAVFMINATEQGLVTRFGKPLEEIAQPGLHLKLPWPIDAVIRVDRRLLVFDSEPTEMLTRDKKNVAIDSFLVWRIADPLRFVETARTKPEAEARLLDLMAAALGAAVGSEPMESFLNVEPGGVKIRDIAERARAEVARVALPSLGVEVVDLELNGFNLPAQNRPSVIQRMRAERARIATGYRSEGEEEALKVEAQALAEREELLARARSEAEKIRGEGEAEALRLLAEAYRLDPQLYEFLRTLETYEVIIDDNTTLFIESDSRLMDALNGR